MNTDHNLRKICLNGNTNSSNHHHNQIHRALTVEFRYSLGPAPLRHQRQESLRAQDRSSKVPVPSFAAKMGCSYVDYKNLNRPIPSYTAVKVTVFGKTCRSFLCHILLSIMLPHRSLRLLQQLRLLILSRLFCDDHSNDWS